MADYVLSCSTSMKLKHALLVALLSTTLGAGATVGSANERPRKEARATARRVASEEQRRNWNWFVAPFRPSAERPCDSTACRPQRFAWSPTAPGS